MNYWTRHWWWIALPTMILAVWLAYISPAMDYEFFCQGGESCFRQWVSALSGWVGALVTFGTLVILMQQHGRLTNEMGRSRFRLCTQMLVHIDKYSAARYVLFERSLGEGQKTFSFEYPYLVTAIDQFLEVVRDDLFERFEQELGTEDFLAPREISRQLGWLRERIENFAAGRPCDLPDFSGNDDPKPKWFRITVERPQNRKEKFLFDDLNEVDSIVDDLIAALIRMDGYIEQIHQVAEQTRNKIRPKIS